MNKGQSTVSVLICTLYIVLCTFLAGCGREAEFEGLSWEHPADREMPRAFAEEEKVPAYAKRWRMPQGFAGFTDAWNDRVRQYLERQTENCVAEGTDAMLALLQATGQKEASAAAHAHLAEVWQSMRVLAKRQADGDYLVYRREVDLPKNLVWETGAEEPELGSPEARKGGTLRLSLLRSFPNTLRPFGPNSNNSSRRYIYDDIDLPLIRLHPGTGKVIPGTADKWAVSADGRTVYFHIDDAARFSDGTKLTARDFVCALFVRTSPYAAEPFYGDYYLNNFSRIAVYGNNCLAVTLASARPYAPFYAAVPASCTPFYAEFGPDYPVRYLWRVPPTTGGYTIRPGGVIVGRQMTLSRVRDWWARDRKYTRYSCNVDNIVYSFINEPSKARELFRIGELDVFSARESDFWYEGLEIEPVYKGYIRRVHFSNIWPRNCFGLHLNCSRPPFDDINMRLGLHHSLNVRLVIDTIFRGDYRRLGSYFSGFGKYTDESITALPYSPEKARAYFAAAGYTQVGADGILCKPDGTRLQVVVSSRIDPLYSDCMSVLKEEAARCGIDLRMDRMDDTVFYLKVKEKNFTAALFSWGFSPPLPDPANFFSAAYAFRADGTPLPGTNNITATADPELDRAIRDSRNAATEEEAVEALHRVQQRIAATAAWVPGWTTDYWRFAQWRWVRWPETPDCRFCPPRYYDPLDSHLYWIDEDMKRDTLKARGEGRSFPEHEIEVPLPPDAA